MSTFYHLYNLTKDDYVKKCMNYEKSELKDLVKSHTLFRRKTKDKIIIIKSKDYIEYNNSF